MRFTNSLLVLSALASVCLAKGKPGDSCSSGNDCNSGVCVGNICKDNSVTASVEVPVSTDAPTATVECGGVLCAGICQDNVCKGTEVSSTKTAGAASSTGTNAAAPLMNTIHAAAGIVGVMGYALIL